MLTKHTRKRIVRILLCILILYTLIHVLHVMSYFPKPLGKAESFFSDFERQLLFTRAWTNYKIPPFADIGGKGTPSFFYYLFLIPLTKFPLPIVQAFLHVVNFGLILFSVFIIWKSLVPRKRKSNDIILLVWFFILALNFWPLLEIWTLNKVEIWEFAAISGIIFLLPRDKDQLVGFLFATATFFKYLPGVLCIYFFAKQRWRILLSALLTSLVFVMLIMVVFGFDNTLTWLSIIPKITVSHSSFGVEAGSSPLGDPRASINAGFQGVITRFFAQGNPSYFPKIPDLKTAERVGFVIRLLVAVLIGLYFYRTPSKTLWHQSLDFAIMLSMVALLAPQFNPQYAILILPSFLIGMAFIYYHWKTLGRIYLLTFCSSYMLVGYFLPLGLINHLPQFSPYFPDNQSFIWWYSTPAIGYVILLLLLLKFRRHAA